MTAIEIMTGLERGDLSPESALILVDLALGRSPDSALWLLRGRLIQIADSPGHALMDAAASFHRAIEMSPLDPEPWAELGYFHHAVVADPDKAEQCFMAALARGAGPRCRRALDELRRDR